MCKHVKGMCKHVKGMCKHVKGMCKHVHRGKECVNMSKEACICDKKEISNRLQQGSDPQTYLRYRYVRYKKTQCRKLQGVAVCCTHEPS